MAEHVISRITLPNQDVCLLKDNGAARSDHTHDISITTTAGVTTTNLSANTQYQITAGGSNLTFKTPSDANNKVTQTGTTTSADYELLFSGTATNDTKTEGANKTSTLTYNPSTKALTTGGTINGYTLAAAAAKGVTDNSSNTDVTSDDTNLITGRTLYYQLAKKGYTTNTGTVTNIITGSGLTGGPITTTGTISISGMDTSSGSTTSWLNQKGGWSTPPNSYHTSGSWNGFTYTATANNGAGELAFTLPVGTTSTQVAVGNHTHNYAASTINGVAVKTAGIPYAIVDSTSTSTAFTATVPGITELTDGVCVLLKNSVVTSAAGFTIDINSLGAKPVYSNMAAATAETTIFNANYTMLFVFDTTRVEGGGWICYRGYDSNTNTIGYQLRTNSTVLKTTDRTRYYRILFTSADGTHWVPANTQYDNSATSSKTVNQRPIDPFGRIVYLGNTTNYTAETDVSTTAIWDQYLFSLGYSFNNSGAELSLTVNAPVYIKCAPLATGGAIIDSATPYVQALPSTVDDKIYIFIGIANSETQVELVPYHPVYEYKNGKIQLYTTDMNVTNTLATTTKYYITGTTSSATNTGTQYFDTGVYVTTTEGELSAGRYSYNLSGANEKAYSYYNSNDQSIDFVFN